jgi:hypothetical protein
VRELYGADMEGRKKLRVMWVGATEVHHLERRNRGPRGRYLLVPDYKVALRFIGKGGEGAPPRGDTAPGQHSTKCHSRIITYREIIPGLLLSTDGLIMIDLAEAPTCISPAPTPIPDLDGSFIFESDFDPR